MKCFHKLFNHTDYIFNIYQSKLALHHGCSVMWWFFSFFLFFFFSFFSLVYFFFFLFLLFFIFFFFFFFSFFSSSSSYLLLLLLLVCCGYGWWCCGSVMFGAYSRYWVELGSIGLKCINEYLKRQHTTRTTERVPSTWEGLFSLAFILVIGCTA
mgnify:CR=1 FL=1